MAIPPFVNTRLDSGDEFDRRKQEELFDGITRNLEDLYNRFATTQQLQEVTTKKIIAGTVQSTGAIFAGSGFTAEKTGTGIYKVTLKEELPSIGSCVANSLASACLVEGGASSKKVFNLAFYTREGVLFNTAFAFIIRQT